MTRKAKYIVTSEESSNNAKKLRQLTIKVKFSSYLWWKHENNGIKNESARGISALRNDEDHKNMFKIQIIVFFIPLPLKL